MGYCNYYPAGNGNYVATWVGTGTDAGKSKKVVFLKGSLGTRSKTAACADARNQFCTLYGFSGTCSGQKHLNPLPPPKGTNDPCAGLSPGDAFVCRHRGGKPDPCVNLKPSDYVICKLKGGVRPDGSTSGGGGGGGSSSNKGVTNEPGCRCGCEFTKGSWSRWANCLGYDFGNFGTDAARTGGEQLPMFLIAGIALVAVLVLLR